jgi:hypothetical protein
MREAHVDVVSPAIIAGLVYVAMVFMVGFGLGAIRVTLIVPHLGETLAVLLEAPIMLAISWKASHWCVARFQVPAGAGARIIMGAVALAILLLAELSVSAFFFGRSATQYVASYRSMAGIIGLAAQIAFAALPLLQTRRN